MFATIEKILSGVHLNAADVKKKMISSGQKIVAGYIGSFLPQSDSYPCNSTIINPYGVNYDCSRRKIL